MTVTSMGRTSGVPPSDRDAQASLMRLATGYRLSQMLCVVAKLGIADLLASGPKTCAELGQLTGSHAPSLYRALRALAAAGVFREQADGRFALTASAELLRSDAPGSVRGYAMMQGEDWIWDAWGRALHSVQTGEPAFEHLHGVDFFTYLDRHPEAAAVFNAGMTARAASADVAVAHAYDFSGMHTIVDVGGGHGLLLASILEAHPAARGVLLDIPSVAEGARKRMAAAGLAQRCQVVGGDFFTSVPTGGDCYTLANVIHDWDDERAVAILRKCQHAMAAGGRVLIVEALLSTG
ncbi:MAG: methyltransferase, partial [Chloroflexi bacterium]|nr:methyltransferase [Chloroflexota bacterium]